MFGPDGSLYVSVFDSLDLKAGYVLKYNVTTGAQTTFAFNNGDAVADHGEAADLHRPEGLTFGPDGKLYVTGFRADANDTDKVVVLNPKTGAEMDSIVLDAVDQPRAYGQAILFGPGGRLFVPISTLGSLFSGAVRSYDVSDGSFVNFEAPGTLDSGWYLTFRNTDPATLAYVDPAPASSSVTAAATPASSSDAAALSSAFGTTTSTSPLAAVAASVPPTSAAVSGTGATSVPAGANDLLSAAWGDDLFSAAFDGLSSRKLTH